MELFDLSQQGVSYGLENHLNSRQDFSHALNAYLPCKRTFATVETLEAEEKPPAKRKRIDWNLEEPEVSEAGSSIDQEGNEGEQKKWAKKKHKKPKEKGTIDDDIIPAINLRAYATDGMGKFFDQSVLEGVLPPAVSGVECNLLHNFYTGFY